MDHLEELGKLDFRCSTIPVRGTCEHEDQCGRAIAGTLVNHDNIDLADEEGRQM